MDFLSIISRDVCVLKTENIEIGAKGFQQGQKSTKMHSSSRIVAIVFMFKKNAFSNGL